MDKELMKAMKETEKVEMYWRKKQVDATDATKKSELLGCLAKAKAELAKCVELDKFLDKEVAYG